MHHTPEKSLSWGLLATGRIAHTFARALPHSRTGKLVAVGSRAEESARRFGREHGLTDDACHGSYDALLADPRVEAIYISTPHPQHAEWAIRAAEAGKHVLCEKPLTLNYAEAMAVVEAARASGVLLMEAFMYRCHPQTARVVELIRQGAIGRVQFIEAAFSFRADFDPHARLFDPTLGGGGILDVGCYPVSLARLVAGAAAGLPFAEPESVHGAAHLDEGTGTDEWAVATLRFPGNLLAQLLCGTRLDRGEHARITGETGAIEIPRPFIPGVDGGSSRLLLHELGRAEPREIVVQPPAPLYALEADAVADNLAARQVPAMTPADSLGNALALDRWREAVGLVYPMERPGAPELARPVHGRPLARREQPPAGAMRYGRVAGLDKAVSRLVLGCDHPANSPRMNVLCDSFFERGGNAFDTAWIYNGGRAETFFGHWLESRGVRGEVVVLGKGAHPPHCRPEDLGWQLDQSLERLRTDHVDVYLLHRDDPAVPAGEFVDALNVLHRAGRVRAFGGSNWTTARVAEANAHAAAHGLVPFTALSNNLSLARMVAPVWEGCVSASDPESRAFLARAGLANFAWSAQARGFFLDRPPVAGIGTNDPGAAEVARCWHSPENFQRRERARTLAGERGVAPLHVALAYVLAQAFPSFALIGPRTVEEIRDCLRALDLTLSREETAWLDLEFGGYER